MCRECGKEKNIYVYRGNGFCSCACILKWFQEEIKWAERDTITVKEDMKVLEVRVAKAILKEEQLKEGREKFQADFL